jgi:undecaprenyl-diphosphatase
VTLKKWASFSLTHWRWLLPAAASAIFVGIFLRLTSELFEGEFEAADQMVRNFALSLRHAAFNAQVVDLSALGSGTVLTIFSLFTLLVFFLMGDRRGALALFVGSLGAIFWTIALKKIVARPRPAADHLVEVGGHSYPSGHSLGAAAVYFLVAFLVIRHFRSHAARAAILISTTFLVGLIGLSRLYLGVHYLSDIASGICFGTGWACLVASIFFVFRQPPWRNA